jgi:hypothetical protein
LVSFGGLTLPHITAIKQQGARLFLEVPLPGRAFDYRQDLGGKGFTFTIDGYVQSTDSVSKSQIRALADGVARILDLQEALAQPFNKVYRYQSTPAWTDDTALAYPGGTPFTVLGATSDYFYLSNPEKWNSMQFTLGTMGAYGFVQWLYSQGNGAWNVLFPNTPYDIFALDSVLNSSLWTVNWGSASVGSNVLTVTGGSSVTSQSSFGPYGIIVISCSPQQTNQSLSVLPITVGSDNISLSFGSNGYVYLSATHGANSQTQTIGTYSANTQTVYTIIWTPTTVTCYVNGAFGAAVTQANAIPIAAGTMQFSTWGGAGANLNVWYVLTNPTLYTNDGTLNLSQNGIISFTSPSDWTQDTVNGVTGFWLRASTPSVATAATATRITMNPIYNCVLLDPLFTMDPTVWDQTNYELTLQQVENPSTSTGHMFDPAVFDPVAYD